MKAMHKCKSHAKLTICKTQYVTNRQFSPSVKSILEAFKHVKVFWAQRDKAMDFVVMCLKQPRIIFTSCRFKKNNNKSLSHGHSEALND